VAEGGIELSPRLRPLLRLGTLLVLGGALLFAAGPAQATTTGTVIAWGCEGIGAFGQCSVPSALSGDVATISAGQIHTLALKDDGTVVAWGCASSTSGQCSVPNGLVGVTAIAAGASHSLALKGDGTVVAWGCGNPNFDFGQCSVPDGLSGVSAIAAADYHSLALKSDGSVIAWGCGTLGSPVDFGQCDVPTGLTNVTAIAAGYADSLALKSDGTVVAWGCAFAGDHGQCDVPGGLSGVTAIAAGGSHSLALKSDGTVVVWGCAGGDFGQCIVPSGLSGVTAIAASTWHSLALKSAGTVVAWGCGTASGFSSDFGQCDVPAGLTNVTAIAAGRFHSLALATLMNQTITFGSLPDKTYGAPDFSVSATASSGLTVSFSASGNCTVHGAIVHITSAGSCTVTASQSGNVNYNPAPDVSQTFAIAKATQTISFGLLPGKTYRDPDFAVSATASSGLAVSFAASGTCTVSGAIVHLTGAGSCTVTASQPGSSSYKPAANVSKTFAITKLGQMTTFGPLTNKTYGAPDFDVSAAASSGLPVSFAASGKCTVEDATVHLTGAGSCTVTASQPGNPNYNPAPAVSRSFSIKHPPCRVPKVVGRRFGAAKKMIAKKHCRTGKVGHAYSRKRMNGIVSSQSRRPGRVLPANTKINLVVSRGRRR
jgi:alpha-tubulin suppressor-like RCC1 family protein